MEFGLICRHYLPMIQPLRSLMELRLAPPPGFGEITVSSRSKILSEARSGYWLFSSADNQMAVEITQQLQIDNQTDQYDLNLENGWNLISIARVPDDNSVIRIFDQIDISLSVWKWENNRFVVADRIDPLCGYWVYLNGNSQNGRD